MHPPTDNKLFAFDGELIQGQGMVVEIPNQWFNLIAKTTMGTVLNIQGLLGGNVNLSVVGPFNGGDADTLEVRIQTVVRIPNKMWASSCPSMKGLHHVINLRQSSRSLRRMVWDKLACPSHIFAKLPSPFRQQMASLHCKVYHLPLLFAISFCSPKLPLSSTTIYPC